MIQIRQSIFETNSSSCHVFMFPKNLDIRIPSTVVLNDDYHTYDNLPNLYFNDACYFEEDSAISFIKFLYKSGVKNIKYTGNRSIVHDAIKKYKNETDFNINTHDFYTSLKNLQKICFGTNVKLVVMEDHDVCDENVAKYGDFESYCAYRLS